MCVKLCLCNTICDVKKKTLKSGVNLCSIQYSSINRQRAMRREKKNQIKETIAESACT